MKINFDVPYALQSGVAPPQLPLSTRDEHPHSVFVKEKTQGNDLLTSSHVTRITETTLTGKLSPSLISVSWLLASSDGSDVHLFVPWHSVVYMNSHFVIVFKKETKSDILITQIFCPSLLYCIWSRLKKLPHWRPVTVQMRKDSSPFAHDVMTKLWAVDCVWNVMAHALKPDFVFRRKGRVHLNRRRGVSSVDYWQPRCAHQR